MFSNAKIKKEILNIKQSAMPVSLPDLETKIAEIAYYKAEDRGFESGYDLDDWLEAEQEFLHYEDR